jgi:hypothetical protein
MCEICGNATLYLQCGVVFLHAWYNLLFHQGCKLLALNALKKLSFILSIVESSGGKIGNVCCQRNKFAILL